MRQTKTLFLVLVALAFTMSASAQSLDSLKTICYEALESDDTATFKTSCWDRYLGITAPMTQVPVPTATLSPSPTFSKPFVHRGFSPVEVGVALF